MLQRKEATTHGLKREGSFRAAGMQMEAGGSDQHPRCVRDVSISAYVGATPRRECSRELSASSLQPLSHHGRDCSADSPRACTDPLRRGASSAVENSPPLSCSPFSNHCRDCSTVFPGSLLEIINHIACPGALSRALTRWNLSSVMIHFHFATPPGGSPAVVHTMKAPAPPLPEGGRVWSKAAGV